MYLGISRRDAKRYPAVFVYAPPAGRKDTREIGQRTSAERVRIPIGYRNRPGRISSSVRPDPRRETVEQIKQDRGILLPTDVGIIMFGLTNSRLLTSEESNSRRRVTYEMHPQHIVEASMLVHFEES